MKKTVLLSFCVLSILLAGCENYDNFTTYEEQTKGCEKWVLSHGSAESDFEWKGSEKIGNKTEITGIEYNDGYADQEIKCEFNEDGKLLGIKSSTLEK